MKEGRKVKVPCNAMNAHCGFASFTACNVRIGRRRLMYVAVWLESNMDAKSRREGGWCLVG